jgi:hypothetical protein
MEWNSRTWPGSGKWFRNSPSGTDPARFTRRPASSNGISQFLLAMLRGDVIAGLCGHTWAGSCAIRQVWGHENRRRPRSVVGVARTAAAAALAVPLFVHDTITG